MIAPAVLVAALIGGVLPVRADVAPPSRVVSNYETATGLVLHRDSGLSVPLPPLPGQPPGQSWSLWLFGDTFQTDAQGNPTPPALPFWPGTWAAIGPYTPGLVPTSLSHVPSPPNAMTIPNDNGPSPLVPTPSGLKLPGGSVCADELPGGALYQAAWPFGATRGPHGAMTLYNGSTPVPVADGSQLVFIEISEVCVYESPNVAPCPDGDVWSPWAPVRWTFQRTKLVAYRPADNTVVATNTLFQTSDGSCLPWQQQLTQPVFSGGYLYLYASDCEFYAAAFGACVNGKVTAARVPVAQLHDPAAYQWASSTGWTSSYQNATTVLPATPSHLGPIMVDVRDFSTVGEGFLLLEQGSYGGHYNIYEATSPAGPWTLAESDVMPGCISGDGEGCYALYGHPELSTSGHLMYSFVNRTEGFVKVTDVGTIP